MRVIGKNGLVYESVDYSYYLAHHGILGQKWGKKNGPPYPLSAGDHSTAEKRLHNENAGKLDSWKKTRGDYTRSQYDKRINKLGSKIEKTKSKLSQLHESGASEGRINRTSNKLVKLAERSAKEKNMRNFESEAIMHMTMKDVRKEQIRVGATVATDALIIAKNLSMANLPYIAIIASSAPENVDYTRSMSRSRSLIDKYKKGELDNNSSAYKTVDNMMTTAKELRDGGMKKRGIAKLLGIDEYVVNDLLRGYKKPSSDSGRYPKGEKELNIKIGFETSSESKRGSNDSSNSTESKSLSNDDKQRINAAYNRAKNEDKWNIDFLEYTQNKRYAGADEDVPHNKNKMLYEYREFMTDSDKWLKKRDSERQKSDNAVTRNNLSKLSETQRKQAESKARSQSVQNYARVNQMRNSGMSYEQIAKKLGISESTVWAMINEDDA